MFPKRNIKHLKQTPCKYVDSAEVLNNTLPKPPQGDGRKVYGAVKTVLSALKEATLEDIHAATALYLLHLGEKPPSKQEVRNALEYIVAEGYAEKEEAQGTIKYTAKTDENSTIPEELQQLLQMKYVTPRFYLLLNRQNHKKNNSMRKVLRLLFMS